MQSCRVLREDVIESFGEAFNKSFAKDTCYPPSQEKWTSKNPSLGHCAVVALIVQEFFGGQIVGCRHHHHYWVRLDDGTDIYFTRDQFPAGTEFCADFISTPEELLDSPRAKGAKTMERFELLKERFWKNMK